MVTKISENQPSKSEDIKVSILKIKNALPAFLYDKYRFYPSVSSDNWEVLFLKRLKQLLVDEEWMFFYEEINNRPYLLGARVSSWDREHFGFKIAHIQFFINESANQAKIQLVKILDKCLIKLKEIGVKFVSVRINGDNLPAIHALEEKNFRYYENIIWAVCSTKGKFFTQSSNVRLANKKDITKIMQIAKENNYQRGHFHCDQKFNTNRVNSLYSKWVLTAFEKNEIISVITENSEVVGVFVSNVDRMLSSFLGYSYGCLKFLALDTRYQKMGLGKKLFQSTISILNDLGVEYIDTGYSSKNHVSAKLHSQNFFYSVYEEATFHLWL